MNLLAVSKKHLDTIARFMAPFASGDTSNPKSQNNNNNNQMSFTEEFKENINNDEQFEINQKSVNFTESKVNRGLKNKAVSYGGDTLNIQ